MSIRALHYVTNHSWVEVCSVCREYGIKAAYFKGRRKVQEFRPDIPLNSSPVRLLFLEENLEAPFSPRILPKVVSKKLDFLCIIQVSPSQGLELGVRTSPRWVSPKEDILFGSPPDLKTKPARDLTQEILDSTKRESILQELHPAFYRVKDKEERIKLQGKVYGFLAGNRKTPPKTFIKKIDDVLASPSCLTFREAVKSSKGRDVDEVAKEYGMDRFEIAFVLSKTTANFDPRKTSTT